MPRSRAARTTGANLMISGLVPSTTPSRSITRKMLLEGAVHDIESTLPILGRADLLAGGGHVESPLPAPELLYRPKPPGYGGLDPHRRCEAPNLRQVRG